MMVIRSIGFNWIYTLVFLGLDQEDTDTHHPLRSRDSSRGQNVAGLVSASEL